MNVLAINTSDKVLGVALLKNEKVIGHYVTNLHQGHAERLMPAIVHLMNDVQWTSEDLQKIVVAKGPGSYTGVRIGLTTAKTLAWALDIPIVGVSSIFTLAYQAKFTPNLICPFFDARRNRVYTGLFQWSNNRLQVVEDEQNINMDKWLEKLANLNQKITFLSPSIDSYRENIIKVLGERAFFADEPYNIIQPTHLALAGSHLKSTNVHTLTPNYLRLAEAEANWLKQRETEQ